MPTVSVGVAELVGVSVLHPIAVSFDHNGVSVMHRPIDQGGGKGSVHILRTEEGSRGKETEEGELFPRRKTRRDEGRRAGIPSGWRSPSS